MSFLQPKYVSNSAVSLWRNSPWAQPLLRSKTCTGLWSKHSMNCSLFKHQNFASNLVIWMITFLHNFDRLSQICDCGMAKEDYERFLLHCPFYNVIRRDLFGYLDNILEFKVSGIYSRSLCDLLLFGKPDLDASLNKMIIEETIIFIKNTKQL